MKKILIVVFCVIMIMVSLTDVFAVTDPGYDPSLVGDDLEGKVKTVWSTIVVIVQILSVACVVFAGLRYMFASADQKADIKQGLIYLSIGAILVFGATTIIQLVTTGATQVISK